MRRVAVATLLAALTILPGVTATSPYDECGDTPIVSSVVYGQVDRCVRVDVPASTVPPPAPSTANTVYVWTAAARCPPDMNAACTGRPGQGATLGVIGVLYLESNGVPGLQRSQVFVGGVKAADRMLLL